MLRHRLAAAAFVASMSPASASAHDPDPQDKADIAPEGLRIELLAGYDDDFLEQGALYGGRIGYDFRVGRRVSLGVDGELTDVTTDQSIGSLTVEDGPDIYVGARATFALSSRFRIHGAGGYTRARHGSFFLDSNGSIGGQTGFHDGYRVSAGGQFSLGRKAFIGAEYRYSEYQDFIWRDQYVATFGFRF